MKRIPAAAASEGSASVSTLPKTTSECASEAGSKTGLEHPARTAPGRPEVDQDDLVVPHGLLERLASDRAGRQVPSSPWNTPTGGVKDGGPKEFWSRSSPRRPPMLRRGQAPAQVTASVASASRTSTAGGVVRVLWTVQCEATASSASRRRGGSPAGGVTSTRTATTRA